MIFIKYVLLSDTICDSSETGQYCSRTEILGDNQLTRLFAINNLVVRRVIPPQFSGYYGMDYIRYSIPSVEVEAEIQKWQREPDEFHSSTSGYPKYSFPKWWPSRNEVVDVGYIHKNHRNTSMNIWVNKESGNFYIYTEWGH
jgi:hypothetical protein